jgi:hypothetical protein
MPLQPLLNPKLPSQEGSLNHQKLSEDTPSGVETRHTIPIDHKPNWKNIDEKDLLCAERRLALFENAVTCGVLHDTQADRLTFFAAIARTLLKATHNAGGFLRRLIECPDYRGFITQADEDTALRWLRESERLPPSVPIAEPEEAIPSLSKDAFTVQILVQDLKPTRYDGHPLALVQRMGYLSDWTQERWDQAALELQEVPRLGQSLPSDLGQTMDAMLN